MWTVKTYSITVLILLTKRGNFLRLYLDLQISLPWNYMYSSDITFLFLTVGILKTISLPPPHPPPAPNSASSQTR